MPLTLAEAKVGMADKVDQQLIDMFRRDAWLLDHLTFDDCVSPGTGGSTLVYGYTQLKTPGTAKVRTLNSEYTPGEAKREEKTTKIVPFGGSFQIDRVLADTDGAIDEIEFQVDEKTKAATNYFHNCVINGTQNASGAGYEVNTFDGLKKMLAGTETEITSEVDLSTSALIDANYNAFLDELDGFIATLMEKPDVLMMNSKMLTKVKGIARRAGYLTSSEDAFGRKVEYYDGIALMDAGQYYNGSNTVDVIPTTNATSSAYGTTDIYAAKLGLNALHAASVDGGKMIKTYLPDLNAPGAVKTGEVEMLAGLVLKNSKKAGVLKGIKVTPKSSS